MVNSTSRFATFRVSKDARRNAHHLMKEVICTIHEEGRKREKVHGTLKDWQKRGMLGFSEQSSNLPICQGRPLVVSLDDTDPSCIGAIYLRDLGIPNEAPDVALVLNRAFILSLEEEIRQDLLAVILLSTAYVKTMHKNIV